MTAEAPPAPPPDAPDWDAIDEDIHCPLCDYNLRGLTVPRCPECGYEFDWPELLDPTKRLHPYLFEHHPERNFRFFWRTVAGTMRPRRFWRELQPQQPSRMRRLIIYASICSLTFVAIFASLFIVTAVSQREKLVAMIQRYSLSSATVRALANRPWYDDWYEVLVDSSTLGLAAYSLLIPAIVLVVLFVFQVSMRRIGIKHQHVLRCVIYSYDVLLWLISLAALYMLWLTISAGWPPATVVVPRHLLLLPPAMVLIGAYRMWIAYRVYLRFPHALATIASVHLIVILIILIVDLEFLRVYF